MTWKSYLGVSGATVLAGWFASSPPSNVPATSGSTQPERSAAVPAAAADIEEQAARLQAGLRLEAAYREPERNPFRFGAKHMGQPAREGFAPVPSPVEAVVPVPSAPLVTLSGIAEDQVGERTERTAILSSPSGVLLVREGEDVLGKYRVAKIEADAVELADLTGSIQIRLTLSGQKSR